MTGDYSRQAGKRLRAVREARGMSLSQVDRASDGQFTAEAVGSWERAGRGLRVERLADYAAWLGVPVTLLLPPQAPWLPVAAGLGWPLEGTR